MSLQESFDKAFPKGATVTWYPDYQFHVPRVMVYESGDPATCVVRLLPMEYEGLVHDVIVDAPDEPIEVPLHLSGTPAGEEGVEADLLVQPGVPPALEAQRQDALKSGWFGGTSA